MDRALPHDGSCSSVNDTARLREKPFISVPEAAKLLGWGERRCYREAQRWLQTDGAEGVIPCRRSGRNIRVVTAELLDLIGANA